MEVSCLSCSRVSDAPLIRRRDNIEQAQPDDLEAHDIRLPGRDMKSVCYSRTSVVTDEDDVAAIGMYFPKSLNNSKSNADLVVLVRWSAAAVAR